MSAGDLNSSETPRRVCLFAGAGGVLGTAFCRAYAAHYDIVAVYHHRRPDAVSQLDSYVDPLAPDDAVVDNANPVYLVQADLTEAGQIEHVIDLTLARHGRIDLLVNNAAYSRFQAGGLLDVDGALTDFDKHFDVNVKVPLQLAARTAQRYWMHRNDNREYNRNVINLSSLSGSRVFPGSGQGIYAASKSAQNQLTRYLAADLAVTGVRVNGIAPNSFPSIVATEDVVNGIRRLDQDSVTGKILVLDREPESAATP